MSPETFSGIWERFTNDTGEVADEDLIDVFGRINWEELDRVYTEAFEEGAQRFIAFDYNAFIEIVAVKGTLSGREIVRLSNVAKSYDARAIYRDLNLVLERGDKVALVGPTWGYLPFPGDDAPIAGEWPGLSRL